MSASRFWPFLQRQHHRVLRRWCDGVLDPLFPPRCAGCGIANRAIWCDECHSQLRRPRAPMCHVCGEPFDPLARVAHQCARCREKPPHFEFSRAALFYNGPARHAVHELKYHGHTALAPRLAPILAHALGEDASFCDFAPTRIVPVPLHALRQRSRGYNQSFLLARELGLLLDVPATELLLRIRATPQQVGLERDERRKNVRGAFELNSTTTASLELQNERVLLLDDVFTTGATLSECARVLTKTGARVACLTLTRQNKAK